ncbi:MAG: shikimate kinase [Leptospiraceae bacterium]|nr:shikimate kinase [Leptospiraceae bacterium]MDW7976665.1 shikimate kinase [Leptospiraceae bacterium]
MKIALIGPRGAGKSKLSRKLSKKIEWVAFSTDILISYEAGGKTIKEIVEQEGWFSFRNREYEILKKLYTMDRIIIDCGGGILFDVDPYTQKEIESQRKIELLKQNSFVIYIQRDLDWLLQKNINNAQRPSLSQDEDYETLLLRRLPVYKKYANFVLDMKDREIEEGVEEILFFLRKKSLYSEIFNK